MNYTEHDFCNAIINYDGDNSKPYCDMVYEGLCLLRDKKLNKPLSRYSLQHITQATPIFVVPKGKEGYWDILFYNKNNCIYSFPDHKEYELDVFMSENEAYYYNK